MNRRISSALAAASALLLAGCVSLEEQNLTRGSIQNDQRTLLLVYASPGPIYVEDDSKMETAAKIVPGLGLVVKSAQDDSATRKSKELAQYLPKWNPAEELRPLLAKELENSGHPGKFIELPDAPELTKDKLELYNRATDVLDWQLRYFVNNPDQPVPRNYSTLLTLDDVLIVDVDLAWEIAEGDEDKATPTLAAVTRLTRAGTSHTMWRHENVVADAAGARTTYEFKLQPDDLIAKYRKLLPGLAQAIVADYRKQLQTAGLLKLPGSPTPYGVTGSSTAASGTANPYGLSPAAAMPYGMSPSTSTR